MQTNELAPLTSTFDISGFLHDNPLGLAISCVLALFLLAVAYRSIAAHAKGHLAHSREDVVRYGTETDYADRMLKLKDGEGSFAQRVQTYLRVNWTCGSALRPVQGDPYSRWQRLLVICCTLMVTLSVDILFFRPAEGTKQVCEGPAAEYDYPTNCTGSLLDTVTACICREYDCRSDGCVCDSCTTHQECDRLGCAVVVPNGFLSALVTFLTTVPISLSLNRSERPTAHLCCPHNLTSARVRFFKYFHKPYVDMLQHETPKMAAVVEKRVQFHKLAEGARQRAEH